MTEFSFFQKEEIAKALKKLIDNDLDKVAFEKPFSDIFIYTEGVLDEDKKAKALKIQIEEHNFYIL